MIKLLVVDDSALMRRHLTKLFCQESGFETLAVRNGVEALESLDSFNPDVITLDINMPEMDGLTCLSNIMVKRPKPVVMVSSLTEEGAEATFEALQLGAVDFIQKPSGTISLDINRIEADLIAKVEAAAGSRPRKARGLVRRVSEVRTASAKRPEMQPLPPGKMGVVLVGSSTGGPGALEEIFTALPAAFPWPIVVAQHMPHSFTGVLARRLATLCELNVTELTRQTLLERGNIYIARGDADVLLKQGALGLAALSAPSSSQYHWHPSVARMVESAISVAPAAQIVGVMLTGMGDDGAQAMTELRKRGGRIIAQDENSSVVFGMPGELVRRGGADAVLPLDQIARQLQQWLVPRVAAGRSRETSDGAR